MKISKYFTDDEIACKCGCGFNTMDAETLAIADLAREFVGHAITPSSGCRCAKHNAKVGGAKASYHVRGMAMDLPTPKHKELYEYLCKKFPNMYGIGHYEKEGFVHVDCRKGAAWRKES